MDAQGKPYIVDYGLLPLLLEFRTAPYLSTPVGRAVRWAAPDLFQIPEDGDGSTINFTYASDVYSFGSLMLQILSGQIPYDYVKRDEQVLYAIAKGLRPNRPSSENITDTYWDFIQGCWSSDPKDRPSAKELLSFIRRERNQ
ncbi:hypothetical protein ID866_10124 [Astraeus odoratus]|nr:hypothetical protein ID866_10124 [Astraeus odoratus]